MSKADYVSFIDCSVKKEENPQQAERELLQNELMRYRWDPSYETKLWLLDWLRGNPSKYPTVTLLTKHVLCTSPTQIDNERIFSLAGRISSPLRSCISIQNIYKLICIARIHRDGNMTDSNMFSYYNSLEEFSDYLISTEVLGDEGEAQT